MMVLLWVFVLELVYRSKYIGIALEFKRLSVPLIHVVKIALFSASIEDTKSGDSRRVITHLQELTSA
jgi:hypothetical protein